jgi:outer membrane lipoprotein-sorting protein
MHQLINRVADQAFLHHRGTETRNNISLRLCVFAVKKKTALLISIAIMLACPGFSQGKFIELKNPSSFLHQFSESAQKISTLTSDIIQEKNLSVLSEKITSKGHFYFKKEKNLRWEYTEPFSYLVIFKDDKIYIKDDDKSNQFDVHSNKMFNEINDIMIGCIRGTILKDDKNFSAVCFENPGLYLVKLYPKMNSLKQFLHEIWIYFDKKDCTISKLEMHESSGDFTKIDFVGKMLNTPVPDEKFTFN